MTTLIDQPRPKTVEEILALPEISWWVIEEHQLEEGRMHRLVQYAPILAVSYGPDDIIRCADAEGQYWKLVRHKDGRWLKMRV